MAVQFPSEVIGIAVGVLVYSFFCLLCSVLSFYLVWIQRERTSYVIFLAFLTGLATTASITQQLHTIVSWRDIRVAQHQRQINNVGNPELALSGSTEGLDLVLFYIQYYCYNVQAILVLLWAVELTLSVFRYKSPSMKSRSSSLIGKGCAMTLPAIQAGLLRLSVIQQHRIVFAILSGAIMATSLVLGAILLAVILAKYVRTRMSTATWRVDYAGHSSSAGSAGSAGSHYADSTTPLTRSLPRSNIPRHRFYDNWLIVRFTIAFMALGAFEVLNILFQTGWEARNAANLAMPGPDFSIAHAKEDAHLFIPGVSASLLVFVVFGTTRASLECLWLLMTPRWLQEKQRARRRIRLPSVSIPEAPSKTASILQYLSPMAPKGVAYSWLPHIHPSSKDDMSTLSVDLERIYSRGRDEEDGISMMTRPGRCRQI